MPKLTPELQRRIDAAGYRQSLASSRSTAMLAVRRLGLVDRKGLSLDEIQWLCQEGTAIINRWWPTPFPPLKP